MLLPLLKVFRTSKLSLMTPFLKPLSSQLFRILNNLIHQLLLTELRTFTENENVKNYFFGEKNNENKDETETVSRYLHPYYYFFSFYAIKTKYD